MFKLLSKAVKEALGREDVLKDLRRKGARLIVGTFLIVITIVVNANYGIEVTRNIALVMMLIVVAADYARIGFGVNMPFLEPFMMHTYEKEGFQGTTFAAIGTLLTLSFTDFDIAIAAISMFMYGDAAANIIDRTFGKSKVLGWDKTIVGGVAMLVICIIIGRIFISDPHTSLFMALFATLIEVAIVAPADDFAVPLFTALGGQFFGALLGLRSYLEGSLSGILLFVVSLAITLGFVGLFNSIRRLLDWQKKSYT